MPKTSLHKSKSQQGATDPCGMSKSSNVGQLARQTAWQQGSSDCQTAAGEIIAQPQPRLFSYILYMLLVWTCVCVCVFTTWVCLWLDLPLRLHRAHTLAVLLSLYLWRLLPLLLAFITITFIWTCAHIKYTQWRTALAQSHRYCCRVWHNICLDVNYINALCLCSQIDLYFV